MLALYCRHELYVMVYTPPMFSVRAAWTDASISHSCASYTTFSSCQSAAFTVRSVLVCVMTPEVAEAR